MPFQPGENVGPYRIIQQLGQGGMATVFKAYHPALDRNVAIKVMHPAFLEDSQFLARFEREARVVAKLDHPNIVPVYDFAEHGGQPYLVMKYVEGQTLKAVLDSRSLAQAEILQIVKSVGAALSYAHKRGVLHRDIKPSNVLLTEEGQVYLADFGLARIAMAGQSSMSGDQLLGTPHYISPEQARGERDLDQGTDIYSLGIVLYQLTVGRVPFSADTPFSIIHDHIYTPLPLPRQTNPQLSEALERILLKALAKERGDRFETIDELVRAFEAAFTAPDLGGLARQATAIRRPQSPPASALSADRSATAAEGQLPRPRAAPAAQLPAPEGRRWPWVLAGLALSSICWLTFAVAASRELRPAPPEPIDAASAAAADRLPGDMADQPPGSDTNQPAAELTSAIEFAKAAVEGNTEDPQARLELAKILEESGMPAEAYPEYLRAGELFLQQQAFPRAAEALLSGARLRQPRGVLEPRMAELLTQALFLGAPSADMLPWVESTRKLAADFPGLPSLEARARLYIGQGERARKLLEEVLAARPQDLLAGAVMVDVLQAEGKTAEARAQARQMLSGPKLPEWLREHLTTLEASLPVP